MENSIGKYFDEIIANETEKGNVINEYSFNVTVYDKTLKSNRSIVVEHKKDLCSHIGNMFKVKP